MNKTTYLIRLVAAVTAATCVGHSVINAGDHGHFFRQLCELVNLAQRPTAAALSDSKAKASFMEIGKLNVSIAPDTWRQAIQHKTQTPNAQHKPTPHTAETATPDPREDYWKEALASVKTDEARRDVLTKAGLQNADDLELAQYRKALKPIAERAFQELQSIRQLAAGPAGKSAQDAVKALKIAAYGREDFTITTAKDTDCKGTDKAQNTRTGLCGAAAKSSKVKSIAEILLCVCAYTSESVKFCESTQSTSEMDLGNNPQNVLTDLLNKCPPPSNEQPVKSREVGQLKAALLQEFRSKGTASYYGTFEANDCRGSSAQGVCVIYKTEKTAEHKTLKETQWAANLAAATGKLETHEAAEAQVTATERSIAAAAAAAYQLKTISAPEERTAHSSSSPAHKAKSADKQTTDSTCANTTKKSAAECEKLDCDYDAENNKCKPKAGTDNTATGTGEGATGATTTGCEKHFTDENGCKKMNEGKDKPVCAWKKGGEADKDKDEFRCRSSSFLLNKQFALSVVSAAFVALLF
uniref:Variant surface glycoprotein 1125.143 n=1 Tax=Trypanosoma brucei TaxID=5691 RepID=A0A1J0R474_9TRYP|nr:variant surface glycoprotein 1125.143 [Trypanosoma brucei]